MGVFLHDHSQWRTDRPENSSLAIMCSGLRVLGQLRFRTELRVVPDGSQLLSRSTHNAQAVTGASPLRLLNEFHQEGSEHF